MRPFRFGLLARVAHSREEWLGKARRAEALGYATFVVPDHFRDQVATSVGIMAAASATTTIRVGSMVFDNDFRHPAVVAKDAATLDLLSGGRFELGLGAGWLLPDYAQTGISFDPGRVRVERLEEAVRHHHPLSRGRAGDGQGQILRGERAGRIAPGRAAPSAPAPHRRRRADVSSPWPPAKRTSWGSFRAPAPTGAGST